MRRVLHPETWAWAVRRLRGRLRYYYNTQNLLARSLHELAYSHNPGFLRFIDQTGLPFKAHPTFKKADLDDRQILYRAVAEAVWNPNRLRVD
jgi:hypothetical protein